MIFFQMLQTFYGFILGILPLFVIGLVLAAIAHEYLPARTLDRLLKDNKSRATLAAAFFAVLMPATSAYRIPIAAIARRGGAHWTPVLVFIAAGAGAGLSTLVVTALIGWQFAILRLVVALIFALVLTVVLSRVVEPQFSSTAPDTEVEPLFSREFTEAVPDDIDKTGSAVRAQDVFQNFLLQARVTLPWLLLSLFLATLLDTVVPNKYITDFFGGTFAPVRATLVGLPFYFVAGLDVPILLVLLKKGMDFGAAVAYMMAVPLLNFPLISVMKRWIGLHRTVIFLMVCWIVICIIGFIFGGIGWN